MSVYFYYTHASSCKLELFLFMFDSIDGTVSRANNETKIKSESDKNEEKEQNLHTLLMLLYRDLIYLDNYSPPQAISNRFLRSPVFMGAQRVFCFFRFSLP